MLACLGVSQRSRATSSEDGPTCPKKFLAPSPPTRYHKATPILTQSIHLHHRTSHPYSHHASQLFQNLPPSKNFPTQNLTPLLPSRFPALPKSSSIQKLTHTIPRIHTPITIPPLLQPLHTKHHIHHRPPHPYSHQLSDTSLTFPNNLPSMSALNQKKTSTSLSHPQLPQEHFWVHPSTNSPIPNPLQLHF